MNARFYCTSKTKRTPHKRKTAINWGFFVSATRIRRARRRSGPMRQRPVHGAAHQERAVAGEVMLVRIEKTAGVEGAAGGAVAETGQRKIGATQGVARGDRRESGVRRRGLGQDLVPGQRQARRGIAAGQPVAAIALRRALRRPGDLAEDRKS